MLRYYCNPYQHKNLLVKDGEDQVSGPVVYCVMKSEASSTDNSQTRLAAVSNGKFFYSGGWYRSKKANGAATVSKTLFEFDLSKWGWDDVDVSEYVSVPELYSGLAVSASIFGNTC